MTSTDFTPKELPTTDDTTGYQTAVHPRPDLVVEASNSSHVVNAVDHALTRGLSVSVLDTGHGSGDVGGDPGVLVRTRHMNGVAVDPSSRTAWVEAGARWRQVIDAAAPHGLAPLSGSSPEVGAVGYSLGGGIGLLARKYGYAADHVLGIDIVDARAQHLRVTAESEPELFWALRGGGAPFGIVTGMRIRLFPVSTLHAGALFFDARDAGVLARYLDWTRELPDEMTTSATLIPFPDLPTVPEPLRGRRCLHVALAHCGTRNEADDLLASLRRIGPLLLDTVEDMPFTESGKIHNDPTEPSATLGSALMLDDLDETTVHTVADLTGPEAPGTHIVGVRHLGGALTTPQGAPNAVSHRRARYVLGVLSPIFDAEPDTLRGVQNRVADAVASWTVGHNLNFDFGPRSSPVDRFHSPGTLAELRNLKAKHDPHNLFRHTRSLG
ncbi:FAD-binding protein [Allosaccharopolyspora coralli]|uniref:FAD-binding protein n=1 Tax=Allosaccharopolyspora coralli TaxID=2665642 RepID=A0A5Q3QCR7_9PSEU|nr:FAD-binding oxidoreductase [Allosaccharopolyspora coralli]QGK71136.1 FAD-binding protein [Allosaccharopolyspora coralli]